ncbi:MAG TPA: acyl-CoA dehydrogenase family protein [Solirubrobacteraceae bacterium]|jgi:alkylation response protein AidB-like acyl-CoA dehydrogenase|nr:acyl-CoA dehydrogenase family protein [Solirubrobacteraceae bacterium]
MRRTIFEDDHIVFRESVRTFLRRAAVPHREEWEENGIVDRSFWLAAAATGFVGFEAPQEFGGLDLDDFRFNAILDEEVEYAGVVSDNFAIENDIIAPYLIDLTNREQKGRWLPGFTAGDLVVAIAMTEPGAGSDLKAMSATAARDGDHYVLNGSKTFVTSGIQAELVIVAARTSNGSARDRFSLLVVEAGTPGFDKGRKLEKIGRRAQDTAELFFNDVVVPVENRLGEEGQGFAYLMRNLPRERLSIAVSAVAAAEHALELTLEYVRERRAFGQTIGSFQANRFVLAELSTKICAARVYVDRCIEALNANQLTDAEAAGIKALTTELQFEVLDRCLQLHGGYGYMDEYAISRLWRDGRVQRIYGGTNEIMKEIVGRALGI